MPAAKSSQSKRRKIMDNDADCRLKNGLNPDCLAQIFQYLATEDLWTLSNMNDLYKQIINELVFSDHILDGAPSIITNMLQSHGNKIKKIHFYGNSNEFNLVLESIKIYCAIDQLKELECKIIPQEGKDEEDQIYISSDHLSKLETFGIQFINYAIEPHCVIFLQFESLRTLKLNRVRLNWDFDWTSMQNVTELELIKVIGINEHLFIQLIRQRPQLKRIVHLNSFRNIQTIGKEIATFCGDHIIEHHDLGRGQLNIPHWDHLNENSYFSGLKKLKKMSLVSITQCARDLTILMGQLANRNALEELTIIQNMRCELLSKQCFSMVSSTLNAELFFNLKIIRVHIINSYNSCRHERFLIKFSSQILFNVESVSLSGREGLYDFDFLKFVPKLRKLSIYNTWLNLTTKEASKVISVMKNTLEQRSQGQSDSISTDFIEIIVNKYQWEKFREMDDIKTNMIKFVIKKPNFREFPISDPGYEYGIFDEDDY